MSIRVLHIINNLDTGGAEKLLVDSLPKYCTDIQVDLLLLDGASTLFKQKLKETFTGNVFTSGLSSIYSPLHVIKLKPYLISYDIIHVHLFPSLYWTAITKFLFRLKVPLLFTEHSTNNKRLKNAFSIKIDRWIYSLYEKIIAITPAVKQELINKLNLKDAKCDVIYNGVDFLHISSAIPYSKYEISGDNKSILLIQVSRFQPEKDQKTVIKSLIYLPKTIKLVLVGDGKLLAECVTLSKQLNLQDRVIFLGSRFDVPELLKTCDIVVQSSHWEGFGLAAVEGMAAGKPVIASNVSGLKDIVENAGLLFEKGGAEDLAQIILKLVNNNAFYRKIAGNCAVRAEQYSLQKMVNSISHLYNRILKSNSDSNSQA